MMTATAAQPGARPSAEASPEPILRLDAVTKRYGTNTAVDAVNLRVEDGEFVTLLGPSGCGKTTLLSILAGFVTPDAGQVLIDGQDMTHVPPHRRPVNTVFQDYALFPHMDVLDNVAFGLRMDGIGKREARDRARTALAGVDLEQHARHRPSALSGGQRQRVALARALVKRPKVLLLDEPFAALDLQLRRRMQLELRQLHRESKTTFVFVTHDQEEAAVLSDKIAVLRDGRVQQLSSAAEIYDQPRNRFVAEFIGESNVFDASSDGMSELAVTGLGRVPAPVTAQRLATQDQVTYAVRPERLSIGAEAGPGCSVRATVEEVMRVGESVKMVVRSEHGATLRVSRPAAGPTARHGDHVTVSWDPDDGRVLGD
jgi:ABC-type Fe3+/spermidine/putrescine transport system ATPase subunit